MVSLFSTGVNHLLDSIHARTVSKQTNTYEAKCSAKRISFKPRQMQGALIANTRPTDTGADREIPLGALAA